MFRGPILFPYKNLVGLLNMSRYLCFLPHIDKEVKGHVPNPWQTEGLACHTSPGTWKIQTDDALNCFWHSCYLQIFTMDNRDDYSILTQIYIYTC